MPVGISIPIGVVPQTEDKAGKYFKKLGDDADAAGKKVEALATKAKAGDQIAAGMLNAAAAVGKFSAGVDAGSTRAGKSLGLAFSAVEQLKKAIEETQKAGSPVSDEAIAQLREFEQVIERDTQRLGELQNAQGDAADATRSARAATELEAGSINDLGDILQLANPKLAEMAGNMLGVVAAFGAGWSAGTKIREVLNEVTGEVFGVNDGFDQYIQFLERANPATIALSYALSGQADIFVALAGGTRDYITASQELANTQRILKSSGIDPTNLSLERQYELITQIALARKHAFDVIDTTIGPEVEALALQKQILEARRKGGTEAADQIRKIGERLAEVEAKSKGLSKVEAERLRILLLQKFTLQDQDAALQKAQQRARQSATSDNREAEQYAQRLKDLEVNLKNRLEGARAETQALRERGAAGEIIAQAEALITKQTQETYDATKGLKGLDAERIAQKLEAVHLAEREKLAVQLLKKANEDLNRLLAAGTKLKIDGLDAIHKRVADRVDVLRQEIQLEFRANVKILDVRVQGAIDLGKAFPSLREDYRRELALLKDYGGVYLKAQRNYSLAAFLLWTDAASKTVNSLRSTLSALGALGSGKLGQSQAFKAIDSILGDIGNVIKVADQVGQTASALGASSQLAGAAGAAAGTVAAFYILYDAVDKIIKAKRAKNFGTIAELGIVDGNIGISEIGEGANKINYALKKSIRLLEDIFRGTVTDLEGIYISVRNDGKRVAASVAGVFLGYFGSVEDAIGAALREALKSGKINNIDPLIRRALESTSANSLDELANQLARVQEIADLGKSAVEKEADAQLRLLDVRLQTVRELGLGAAGEAKALGETLDYFQQWHDKLLGIRKSEAEQQADEKRSYDLKLKMFVIQLLAIKSQIQAEVVLTRVRIQSGENGRDAARNINAYSVATLSLSAIMASGATDAAKALLLIEQALKEAAALTIPDGTPLALPGGGGGRNSDAADRRRRREELRQEAELFGRGDVARQIAEAREWLKRYIEELNKSGLTAEEVARLTREAREEEERRLRVIERGVRRRVADFMGRGGELGSGMRDINDTAGGLIKDLRELKDAGKLSTAEFRALKKAILAAAQAQRDALVTDAANSLLLELYDLLGKDTEAAQLKYQLALAELEIKRAELEMAIASGDLSADVAAHLRIVLGEIGGLINDVIAAGPALFGPPPAGPPPGGGGAGGNSGGSFGPSPADVREELARQAEDIRRRFDERRASHGDPLQRELRELEKEFQDYRRILGNTAEVQEEYARSLQEIQERYLETLLQDRRDLFNSDLVPIGAQERFDGIGAQLAEAMAALAGGDTSQLARIGQLINQHLQAAQAITPRGSVYYRQLVAQDDLLFAQAQSILQALIAAGGGPLPPGSLPPLGGNNTGRGGSGTGAGGGALPPASAPIDPNYTVVAELRRLQTIGDQANRHLSRIVVAVEANSPLAAVS